MTVFLVGISMLIVAGLFGYSSNNSRLNQRSNEYYTGVGAAEAATEKILSQVNTDFQNFGDGYVLSRIGLYRTNIPSTTEAAEWDQFDFMDLSGQAGRVEVDYYRLNGFSPLGGQYGQLKAWKDRVRIISNARLKSSIDSVAGSVFQDIEFTRIPIFQYAVFYNIPMEYTPLPNMTITGPVHCNTNIYMNPFGVLTFNSDVTCSGTIITGPNPAGPLPNLGGSFGYGGAHDSGVSTLSLPIGTNNSPAAVLQVLDVPPGTLPLGSETASSSLALQRYYNQADMIILVSNTTIMARSGRPVNSFATVIGTNDYFAFLSTSNTFYNKRELKTVRSIDIDVAKLVAWNLTNTVLRPSLTLSDVRTIYVADFRTMGLLEESGVRLVNGTNLPPQGLTVATPSPLYILGNYNSPAATRGTTNTIGTLPASVAADAVTVLSTAWRDTNSNKALGSRIAANTTVNAALLTGIVQTTLASDSGGVENFPRYLEDWTGYTNTYNGSMVGMFYSRVATGLWLGIGPAPTYPDIYNPPYRNWALDQNYADSNKLPPATPALTVLVRAKWRTPAAYSTNVLAGF